MKNKTIKITISQKAPLFWRGVGVRLLHLLIIILLTVKFAFSQNKNISVGITGGADYYNNSFWGFPNTTSIDTLNFEFPKGEHEFKQVLNYNFGLALEYKINKLFLIINAKYSGKDYKIDYNMDFYTVSSGGIEITYLPIDNSILRFRYLDINANIGYEIVKLNKLSIIPSVGLKTGLLLSKESKITYEDKTVYIDKNNTDFLVQHQPENIIYAINFNLGIKYNVNQDISLVFNPYFAQYLNQTVPLPMKQNPMAYGINCAILYKLNNNNDE